MKTVQEQSKTKRIIDVAKNKLSSCFKLEGLNVAIDEYQQAIFRLFAMILITIFLLTSIDKSSSLKISLVVFFGIATITLLTHIRKHPAANVIRRYISMLIDVAGTSSALYLSSDIGGIFIGVFLWFIIGYGLRYGKVMLVVTLITSLCGFITASMLSEYWQAHLVGFFGLLFTLITVPIYALSLLSRLQEATRKAEAASKAKSEFLSHISHEIRTPLNGIVGACDLLGATNLSKDHSALLNVMKSSSSVLLDLVNNVLDLSKIESGKIINSTDDFYLQDLITITVNLFESQARQKGVSIAFEISKDTPLRIHGDLLHTKQVLINLVGNAVKFTEQGSIKINVYALEQSHSQATIRFEVIDTGTGIAADSLPNIFESFVQAKESKYKFGGTGLGTTISKNLVELMNGQIGVESTLGAGSTFWFELPFEKLSSNNTNQDGIASEIIPFKKAESKKIAKTCHILIAEDNETNVLIITQMLDLLNHTYEVVGNGELALDKLRDQTYDLMILDFNMPIMGGLEALKIYQALNIGQPLTPAIMLTADATNDTKMLFEDLNISAFLTKPIQIDVLGENIEKALNTTNKTNADVIQYQQVATKAKLIPETKKTLLASQEKVEENYLDIPRLEALANLSKNDQFLQNLIQGFITDTEQNFRMLVNHIIVLDYFNINDCGHAIKGSAANIGAKNLALLSAKINDYKPSDSDDINALLSDALDCYEKTKLALMHYLTQRNIKNKQSMAATT